MLALQTYSYPYTPYGQMAIRNNPSNIISIPTATDDSSLLPVTPNTTYFKIEGFSLEYGRSIVLEDNGLKVLQDGIYRFGGWASARHSNNNSTVGVLFVVRRNGVIIGNTPSPVPALMPNIGDVGLIAGEGFTKLLAGDVVEVFIGSDTTGTVMIENCTITGVFISPY